MLPSVKTTWAPRGETPIIRQRTRHWQKVSAIGALALSPRRHNIRQYVTLYPNQNIRAPELIGYLKDLLREIRGQIVLVWDRLNVHRSRDVAQFIESRPRLDVEYLPPYAPELNPVEHLWCATKHHRMAGHAITDLDVLEDRAAAELDAVADDRDLLRSFFRATPLPLKLDLVHSLCSAQ